MGAVKSQRVGVIAGTFQPFHFGHLNDLKRNAQGVDELLVLVSDFPVVGRRFAPKLLSAEANPFTYEERRAMIEGALRELGEVDRERFTVAPLIEHIRAMASVEGDARTYLVARSSKFVRMLDQALKHMERRRGSYGPQYPTEFVGEAELRGLIRSDRDWRQLVPDSTFEVVLKKGTARV